MRFSFLSTSELSVLTFSDVSALRTSLRIELQDENEDLLLAIDALDYGSLGQREHVLNGIELWRVCGKGQRSQRQLVHRALGSGGEMDASVVEDENSSPLPGLELSRWQPLLMMTADEFEELRELDLSVGAFSQH